MAATDNGVTVIAPAPQAAPKKTTDGTPVVHKSSHKKKSSSATASTGSATSNANGSASSTTTPSKTTVTVTKVPTTGTPSMATPPAPPSHVTVMPASGISSPFYSPAVPPVGALSTQPVPMSSPISAPPVPTTTVMTTTDGSPQVETGLPVARQGGDFSGNSYVSLPLNSNRTAVSHSYYAGALLPPITSSGVGSFSVPTRSPTISSEYNYVAPRRSANIYPWKTAIVTTMFWIGEGSTPISHTDNVQSSWDEDWLENNHGSDNPYNRSSYASGSHASTLNPFYCALPFNDLAFPDKTRRWLPAGWYRKPKDGKQVSACKDRWVEIKNAKGDICYAQWEDVGPLRYDHAEYVFGPERPIGLGDDHAGLDVSPAVAAYLNISDKNRYTSWRFVDDEDVRPGAWLKYDEQAVLFRALKQIKEPTARLAPIQRTEVPIDDSDVPSANKRKLDQSK